MQGDDDEVAAGARAPIAVTPIGVVRSPYTQRFGTPRQATVTEGVLGERPLEGRIELFADRVPPEATQDLAGFDLIWVLSWFHLNTGWKPLVVPIRGPKVRRGLLSTRAPHRPNPIGLSACRLVRVDGCTLHVEGIDLLDGTPVLDVKPYLHYADAFPDASAGWVDALGEPADGPDRPTKVPARKRR